MTYGTAGDVQFPLAARHGRLWLWCWVAAALAAWGLVDLGVNPVFASAWLVVLGWVAAEWSRNAWAWLLAWAAMAVHLAVAMGVAHGWSHAHAYDHTEEVSGFGPGIYVSYAVVSLWGLDAVLGVSGVGVRWLYLVTRGLVAFVMFNATVVYGTWPGKVLGLAVFALLAWVWWKRRPVSGPRQRAGASRE